jgi:hypothetical protein
MLATSACKVKNRPKGENSPQGSHLGWKLGQQLKARFGSIVRFEFVIASYTEAIMAFVT